MFTFHMTIPVGWSAGGHPLGAKPDDWFDVEVECSNQHAADIAARLHVKDQYGDNAFFTTYLDGPEWDYLKERGYRKGECVATIKAHESYIKQAEAMA